MHHADYNSFAGSSLRGLHALRDAARFRVLACTRPTGAVAPSGQAAGRLPHGAGPETCGDGPAGANAAGGPSPWPESAAVPVMTDRGAEWAHRSCRTRIAGPGSIE